MNRNLWQQARALWHAEFFSPKDFVRRAALICIVFALAQLLGLRDFTSMLNGTTGSVAMSWEKAAFLGIVYVALYLAFILLVPIFLIAAGLLVAWRRCVSQKSVLNASPGNRPSH